MGLPDTFVSLDPTRRVTGLDGRYNWDDDADPTTAEFLADPGSVRYLADGRTALAYVGLYTCDAERIGEVGITASDLPGPLHAVYRVEPARAARRRDGAEDELQRSCVGQLALRREIAPIARCRGGPFSGCAENLAGFFPEFADRGAGEGGRAARRRIVEQAAFAER